MLSLNDRNWNPYKIKDIFVTIKDESQVPTGAYIEKQYLDTGNTPRVTVTSTNNGIDNFWSTEHKNNREFSNFISVNFLGDAFYHPYTASLDMKVHCLKLKDRELNADLASFICCALKNNTKNSNYGYQLSSTDIVDKSVLLPSGDDGKPDFDFMEAYAVQEKTIKLDGYIEYCKHKLEELGSVVPVVPIEDKQWKAFFVVNIFDEILRGKRLKKDDHIPGKKPYVSSTALNNGVDQFIGNTNKVRVYSDCLSLANSGSVGSCFYEPFEFIASDHVTHLKKNNTSEYVYFFMATMLRRLSQKYNFNREINDARIKREIIMLPVGDDGMPDYDYMEQYIKNIMIEKYKSYLNYIA